MEDIYCGKLVPGVNMEKKNSGWLVMAEELEKQRIIQEYVPGKQVTMAHLIANPVEDIYRKMGVISEKRGALGIMTITPSEAAIIGADIATKTAPVDIVFVDRFSGSLILCGDVAGVEDALNNVNETLHRILGFTPTEVTKT